MRMETTGSVNSREKGHQATTHQDDDDGKDTSKAE